MTSNRLLAAGAAAAALLMAAPPLAGAALREGSGGQRVPRLHKRGLSTAGCRLTLRVEPRRITSGDETPQLFGRFVCPGFPETAGETVTVQETVAGHLTKVIGTTTTMTSGYYSYVAPAPTANAIFHTFVGNTGSPTRQVNVAPEVTISGPPESTTLFTGVANRVTFAGTVSPAATGAEVVLQREAATANEDWVAIQRGIVGPGGAYAFLHTFLVPGDANIRVLVRARGRFTVYGVSSSLSYAISQHENPLLTLSVAASGSAALSGDPILYGQAITLSGVLAGGADKPVTLLARTVGGAFVAIASATADSSGHYQFETTPLQDTSYRVLASNGTHSSVLFEGVKYRLTAEISATSLEDGQAFTVSGFVTPYHAGHLVYLERQNVSGNGYHVVAVAKLTPSGTGAASYSVAHAVFGVGRQLYRIKVPGDPGNLGAASAPFAVEVTPAPAAALQPGPPNTPPGEGHA